MADLDGRVALVAGGSGGIGAATARALAAAGADVRVGFKSGAGRAAAVVDAVRAAGGRAEAVALDLLDPEAAGRVCRELFDRAGRLDILVNCAAANEEAPAAGMEDAAWDRVRALNLDAAFRLCRAAAKYMVLGRRGRIVTFSSVSARRGGRGQVNYAASKAGVEAMTRVLALELGRKGVLVNCIAPGVIETPMSERVRREHGGALAEEIALRRFGRPEEVAACVVFLVSDAAGYITGQTIRVDGGMAL